MAWIGRDDNQPVGLTGSAGALRVWSDVMAALGARDLRDATPEGLVEVDVEYASGLLADPRYADSARARARSSYAHHLSEAAGQRRAVLTAVSSLNPKPSRKQR